MTKEREALKLALGAAEIGLANLTSYQSAPRGPTIHEYGQAVRALAKVREAKKALAQPEQEPVAWPCLIAEADFSQNTVTLIMQCTDYKVSAVKHWLSTTPPQRQPLTDEQKMEIQNAIGLMKIEDEKNNFGNYEVTIQILEEVLREASHNIGVNK